jgi:hypothetical protein
MPETISPASGSRRGNPRMEPPVEVQQEKNILVETKRHLSPKAN